MISGVSSYLLEQSDSRAADVSTSLPMDTYDLG